MFKDSAIKRLFFERFSAVREEDGSVSGVLYPPNEHLEVLAFKKSLAGLFSIDVSSSSWTEAGSSLVLVQEVEGQGVGGLTRKTTAIDRESGVVTKASLSGIGGTGKLIPTT